MILMRKISLSLRSPSPVSTSDVLLRSALLSLIIALAVPLSAHATFGYFQVGHGSRSTAMGGASIAYVRDAIAIAVNPAGMSWIGDGLDVSLVGFAPTRGGMLDTGGILGESFSAVSENSFFIAPNLGACWRVTKRLSLGFSLYSSGGMNTEYQTNLYHQGFAGPTEIFSAAIARGEGFEVGGYAHEFVKSSFKNAPNTGTLGVNLEQAVFAPSASLKLTPELSVGASLLLGFQRFSAQGFGDFVALSSTPTRVTDRGADYAIGAGIRAGLSYRVDERLEVGAVASSKVYMTPFDQYRGLFAEEGRFDIPAHIGFGVSARPLRAFTISADITRIFYGGVRSVSNPGPSADQLLIGLSTALKTGLEAQRRPTRVPVNQGAINPLGSAEGYGFGWSDIWTLKTGLAYQASEALSLMVGYAYGQDPVADSEALFNLIAPAVVQHHLTGGASYQLNAHHILSVSYTHAVEGEVNAVYKASPEVTEELAGSAGLELSYHARAWMSQHVLEFGYRYQF